MRRRRIDVWPVPKNTFRYPLDKSLLIDVISSPSAALRTGSVEMGNLGTSYQLNELTCAVLLFRVGGWVDWHE